MMFWPARMRAFSLKSANRCPSFAGDEIMVSVKDNGVGIPASMLSQVFEMFTQVDRSLENPVAGWASA